MMASERMLKYLEKVAAPTGFGLLSEAMKDLAYKRSGGLSGEMKHLGVGSGIGALLGGLVGRAGGRALAPTESAASRRVKDDIEDLVRNHGDDLVEGTGGVVSKTLWGRRKSELEAELAKELDGIARNRTHAGYAGAGAGSIAGAGLGALGGKLVHSYRTGKRLRNIRIGTMFGGAGSLAAGAAGLGAGAGLGGLAGLIAASRSRKKD